MIFTGRRLYPSSEVARLFLLIEINPQGEYTMSLRTTADIEVSLPILAIPAARKLINKHFTGHAVLDTGKPVSDELKEALWMLYHAQKVQLDVLIHEDGTMEFSMPPTVIRPMRMTKTIIDTSPRAVHKEQRIRQ